MENGAFRLALVGDCMLGRLVNAAVMDMPPEHVWGDTLPVLLGADARICNLECVISDRGAPWSDYPKAFHFRSTAKNIALLRAARMSAVSLANNHVLDYGCEALSQMLEILDRAGIAHSGAGKNLSEASGLAAVGLTGMRLGLVAFTDNEPGWEASESRAGIFYVPVELRDSRAKHLLDIVSRNRETVDVLVVSAHWGPNWGYEPPRSHVHFAHALVDAGADIVFGHSSHVFRGIEFYRGRPILYGAGNFVDDYAVDEIERNDESFIFVVEIENGAARGLRLYPTMIAECRARRASGADAEGIAIKMERLWRAIGTPAVWGEEVGSLAVGYGREAAESSVA
jgi:poly-gamma-glutamate capsule biosynthesis protein CapA/YwtB (metallophosphatase superfamily)